MTTTAPPPPQRKLIGPPMLLLNLVVMTALALLIHWLFGPKPLWAIVTGGRSVAVQIGCGLAIGAAIGVLAWLATPHLKIFDALKSQMLELATRLDLRGLNPVWMGLCAGVGEEALFRGALQPLLGLWWTSLIFVLVHYRTGGFRSMNPAKFLYAALIFLVSVMLGYEFKTLGLIAAMATHTAVDWVGLVGLRIEAGRQPPPQEI